MWSLVGKAAWNQGDMYCLVTSSNQATLAKGKKFSCHSAISLTAYIYRDATVVKLNSNNETLLGGHQKWMATKAWRTIWDWRQEVMLPQDPYFSCKNSPTDGWVDSNSIDTLTMDLKKTDDLCCSSVDQGRSTVLQGSTATIHHVKQHPRQWGLGV